MMNATPTSLLGWLRRWGIASRKYELVWGLAERLLDDNVSARTGAVTRSVLAPGRVRSHAATAGGGSGGWGGMETHRCGAGRSCRARGGALVEEASVLAGRRRVRRAAAEKLAAELLWLGHKMAECGAVRDAVVQFGASARLGS
jgi:hypothetical protein